MAGRRSNRKGRPAGRLRALAVRVTFLLAVAAIVLWAAGVFHGARIEPGPGQPGAPPASLAAVPEPPRTLTTRLERVDVVEDAVGTVTSRTRVAVAAQVTARVVTVGSEAGDSVHAGDPLVDLDDRELAARLGQAREALAAAEASLASAEQGEVQARARREEARAQWERTKRFLESGAATSRQMEQAEADHRGAEAAEAAARAQVEAARAQRDQARLVVAEAEIAAGHARILSPIDGVVEDRQVDPGDLAWPGRTLLVVLDPHALRLEARVREGLIGSLRPGLSLAVEIEAARRSLEGTVTEILPAADPRSRTFDVRVDLEEVPGLHPGMFGRLRLPVGSRDVLRVPAAAIRRVGQLEVATVRGEGGRWVRRLVTTGARFPGGLVEVLSGLDPGDEIGLPAGPVAPATTEGSAGS